MELVRRLFFFLYRLDLVYVEFFAFPFHRMTYFTSNNIFIDIAMNKHLMKLAHEVAGDWEILATFLGVSDAKKQQISRDNNQKVVLQAYEMLKHWWLSNGKDANSGWRDQLAQALREFGRVDLAEDFTGDVLQTNT
jgi:hypothetical protein